ncbi:DUF1758 domain-containing protein [Trichonephila clavipes]|nr:DUF1758 domain-containing protein [Trichonephila clavipes]
MYLVILNLGQVTRTTQELAPPSPNYHIKRMGGYRALIDLTSIGSLYTAGLQRHQKFPYSVIKFLKNLMFYGTVESTDTIVKLKTKIENSSTFENDPDFVKTLIQNCIDERVSRNEREATLEKQKIELAKLQLAQLEKEVELQTAKNEALRRDIHPICCKIDGKLPIYYCSLRKVNSFESLCDLIISDKLFETLNKETATHIGIREAEDWFRPIDLAKECDIYNSSRSGSHKETPITYGYTQDPFKNRSQNFKPKIKENYPQYLERENKNCFIYAVIHLITQETVRSVLNPKNLTTTSIIEKT